MKIVQINCTYNYGSTGKITRDLHNTLKENGFESIVLYGRRQNSTQSDVVKTCSEVEAKSWNLISRFTGRPYAVAPIGTNKLIAILRREKPDIVHLQCVNGFFVNIYQLLEYLKQKDIPTVITLHAEFMYTGNCGHSLGCEQWKFGCTKCPDIHRSIRSKWLDTTCQNWHDMKKAFENFDKLYVCAVSDWVKMRAKQSLILNKYPMVTILNGIDTTVFSYQKYNMDFLKCNNQLQNKKIVLHVTADFQNPIKGGKYILELSNCLDPEKYTLIIVDGNDNEKPDNFHGIYWGKTKSQEELAMLYSIADITVITSERETFSMVCAESLCCGTPVVGFKAGAPELISMKEFSEFCEYGEIGNLYKLLKSMLERNIDKEVLSQSAIKKYSNKYMVKKYIELYEMIRSKND